MKDVEGGYELDHWKYLRRNPALLAVIAEKGHSEDPGEGDAGCIRVPYSGRRQHECVNERVRIQRAREEPARFSECLSSNGVARSVPVLIRRAPKKHRFTTRHRRVEEAQVERLNNLEFTPCCEEIEHAAGVDDDVSGRHRR